MSSTLNLNYTMEAAVLSPPRHMGNVFMMLAEEVGEVATAINRPEKAPEPLLGELADVINCVLDLYYLEYGTTDLTMLDEAIKAKTGKWRRKVGVPE